MLREVLDRIGREYPVAMQQDFTGHPLGTFIRKTGPQMIADTLGDQTLRLMGGCGISGNWSIVPWIGIFDPAVSDSAQRGFYLVYLFSADMQRVYLSMNQGTVAATKEFGQTKRALEHLTSLAHVMRTRTPGFAARFSSASIDLASSAFFPRGYEAGHAWGASYDLHNLPEEQRLREDLEAAIHLYRTLILSGGVDVLSEEESEDAGLSEASVEERRRYVAHLKIERNPRAGKAAKKAHGYVCQGCEFDFAAVYGEFANGYIEAHHLVPLSSLPDGATVALDPKNDFAVLCANCHRMMHRKGGPKTVTELRALPGVQAIRDARTGGKPPR